jgi:hypothetical protein
MFVLAGLVGALVAVPIAVYASHNFDDVPNSNTFHEEIEWMAENGVTKGCNPPANDEFCPHDYVTREQMAAFLHRFAAAGLGFDSSRVYANWYREFAEESNGISASCDAGDVLLSGATTVEPSFAGSGQTFEYEDGPLPAPVDLWTMPDPDPNIGPRFRVDGPFTGWGAKHDDLEAVHWAVVAYCYDVP